MVKTAVGAAAAADEEVAGTGLTMLGDVVVATLDGKTVEERNVDELALREIVLLVELEVEGKLAVEVIAPWLEATTFRVV